MPDLNATAACILGLLQMGPAPGMDAFGHEGPMTGGQLHETASRSVSRFWNVTRSQIYAELPKLDAAGLVARSGPTGPRASQAYRITEAGRDAFAGWIDRFAAAGPRDDQVRSPLLLSVFFGHFLEPDRLRRLLEEYRLRHLRVLEQTTTMLDRLGDDHSLPGAALARRVAYERLMVDWLLDVAGRVPSPEDDPGTTS